MNILVCIKQVPGTTHVEIDEKTGTMKRDGVEAKMNPFDLYALETALRIKQKYGAKVSVLTMGPPQAEKIIKEAFMMGADEGYILSDRKFGGADVLATSHTLASGASVIPGISLIICGKQTTDGDTAQVGAELAEWMNIPHEVNICEMIDVTEKDITVKKDSDKNIFTEKISFPCLLTVEKGIYEPRLPSFRLKIATENMEIHWLKLEDLKDKDPEKYGLNGSPTRVKRIFTPENETKQCFLEGSDTEKAIQLCGILKQKKLISETR